MKALASSLPRFLAALVLLLILSSLNAQSIPYCGLTDADQDWPILPPLSDPAIATLKSQYDLPIHVHIFAENGITPHPAGRDLEAVLYGLEYVNEVFPDRFNFYICQVDYYDEQSLYNATSVHDFADFVFDNNAINIYAAPFNSLDHAAQDVGVLMKNYEQSKVFAHELGHFFSLRHTFLNTYFGGSSWTPPGCVYLALDNDSDCIDAPPCDPLQSYCRPCNSNQDPCECNGDLICDTGTDPGIGFCLNQSSTNSPCIIVENGITYTFDEVPYDNLMSYYLDTQEIFSDQQGLQMLSKLMEYTFLTDENLPECDDIDQEVEDFITSTQGIVERVNFTSSPISYDPLPDWRVAITNTQQSGTCVQITGEIGQYLNRQAGGSAACETVTPAYTGGSEIVNTGSFTDYQVKAYDNGVTTLDIIKIIKHILGTEPFNNPFAKIAADVNNSGSVSTLDIVKIRKLILQIDNEFADVPAWRLIPRYAFNSADQTFESEFYFDPFAANWDIEGQNRAYNAVGNIPSYLDQAPLNFSGTIPTEEVNWSFWAVKSGDVNASADVMEDMNTPPIQPGVLVDYILPQPMPTPNASQGQIIDPNVPLVTGQKFILTFKVANTEISETSGYQLFTEFLSSDVEIQQIQAGNLPGFTLENFNTASLINGEMKTLWYNEAGQGITFSNDDYSLFSLELKALKDGVKPIDLFETDVDKSMVFDNSGQVMEIPLVFEFREPISTNKITSIYPNPFSNQVSFEFDLVETVSMNIKLRDSGGNQIQHQVNLGPGIHQFLIPSTSSLSIGQLTYEVEINGKIIAGLLFKF